MNVSLQSDSKYWYPVDSCSGSDFKSIKHWEIICLLSTAATTTVIRFTALPQFFTNMGTWEMRFGLYHHFAQYNMYFLLSTPFPFPFYPPTLSLFLHPRSVYLWPTSPTMAMIDLVFTHSSTWPPSFARGQTWNSTHSHRCSLHTSTFSFFLNKGTHSGRCVCVPTCMGLCVSALVCKKKFCACLCKNIIS